MRKIISLAFISLDGVMQAPGGPDEDTSGGFKYGGWTVPYSDEADGQVMAEQMKPADLLLGRKTFDIFESYWPSHAEQWPGVNEVTKYVLSTTRNRSDWENSVFFSDVAEIRKLKNSEGGDIKVWGSSKLVQLLLEHGLVDELWLHVYPVVLGKGKRLFADTAMPASFTLKERHVLPKGLIIAQYMRAGEVETGTMED